MGNMVHLPARLDEEVIAKIKVLSEARDVPVNEIISQAVDALQRKESFGILQGDIYNLDEMMRAKFRKLDEKIGAVELSGDAGKLDVLSDKIETLENVLADFAEILSQQKNSEEVWTSGRVKWLFRTVLYSQIVAEKLANKNGITADVDNDFSEMTVGLSIEE